MVAWRRRHVTSATGLSTESCQQHRLEGPKDIAALGESTMTLTRQRRRGEDLCAHHARVRQFVIGKAERRCVLRCLRHRRLRSFTWRAVVYFLSGMRCRPSSSVATTHHIVLVQVAGLAQVNCRRRR